MNLIFFTGGGENRRAWVQMLSWASVQTYSPPSMTFTNLMAVDKEGRTWFVPSAKTIRADTHSAGWPINYSVNVLVLEGHGVVRRQSEI